MSEAIVKYESKDGQEINLSFDIIKKYLVQGDANLVKPQECMYFLGICKARGLNPFKKDAYLIKYGAEPAAIVISIDYFRSRAKVQPDCQGWKKGIIVKKEDGEIKDSFGLVSEGETLIGGFFEAKPKGWAEYFRLEVNLNGYLKKTKDGRITKFWQLENQPAMIAKVAESQGLRTLWPDEFQGMYERDEINIDETDVIDVKEDTFDISEFNKLAAKKIDYPPDATFDKFILLTAEAQGITIDELKYEAAKEFNSFWTAFETWRKKEHPSIEVMKKAIEEITTLPHLKNWRTKHKDEVNSLPAKLKSEISTIWTKRETELKEAYKKEQEDKQENKEEQPSVIVKCPNRNYEKISVEVCGNCKNISGCPSYEDATLNLKG